MRFIVVTGGIVSGLGKGITASSIGLLLKSYGFTVTAIKIDPYLNIDAGLMSPCEHGETYVLQDGGECDLDLGNYERFLDINLTKFHNITTGKIYQSVINKERKGAFLGKTVQVIPHITDEIELWIDYASKIPINGCHPHFCIIELGGTIGDIETMPFIEAIRRMSLNDTLAQFQSAVAQCDSLIAHAHMNDSSGVPLLPLIDRQQITTAGFLNLFISWETFLEEALCKLMIGLPTISGSAPTRYVLPPTKELAHSLVVGVNRKFFDYSNHDNVRKIALLFFEHGYPFESTLSSICQDLADMKTIRNASAHLTSSTQTPLESLAQRLFSTPQAGITLYDLLTRPDPSTPGSTIFGMYKNKLLAAGEMIANG